MSSLYLKKSTSNVLQVSGSLAVASACCCTASQTNTCGSHLENCSGGVAPVNIFATISITTGAADACTSTCSAKANGTYVVPLRFAALSTGPFGDTFCGNSYSFPSQCFWDWYYEETFSAAPGCSITHFSLLLQVLKFPDGYRVEGVLQLDNGGSAVVQLVFLSNVLDTSPVNCMTVLDGLNVPLDCVVTSSNCNVTGGTLSLAL